MNYSDITCSQVGIFRREIANTHGIIQNFGQMIAVTEVSIHLQNVSRIVKINVLYGVTMKSSNVKYRIERYLTFAR